MGEVAKLQQHLSLLKEEYSKLQSKFKDVESKYNAIAASNGDLNEDSFACRLIKTIDGLYDSRVYSDLRIKLADCEVNAHKLVLNARSDLWNFEVIGDKTELDWSVEDPIVAKTILQWLYTSNVKINSDELTIKLIKKAHEYNLKPLVEQCEQFLISIVSIRKCVKFYSIAEEINAVNLREYCSGLISTHWEDLNSSDFEHMDGPLLYKMLKSKTQLPLHSAVRLQREDVVFLCLVENSTKLSDIVNVWSPTGELPLDLALRVKNDSIAKTLVQHNADVNIRDSEGDTLLHRAIKKQDSFSALFLLDNNCDVTLATRTENDTALHLAAGATDTDDIERIASKLIEDKHVNVNAQNRHGLYVVNPGPGTALHIAIQSDNRPIFDMLLSRENVDLDLGRSPLYYALLKYEAEEGYARDLLGRGCKVDDGLLLVLIGEGLRVAALFYARYVADLGCVNGAGETALHLAAKRNYPDVAMEIVRLGGGGDVLTYEGRQSALHYAVNSHSGEVIGALLGGVVTINGRDSNGDTPLSLALRLGHNDLVPVLIEGGADVNVRNAQDFTLLHQAILREDSHSALFLLECGADASALTTDGETPLQLAIHCRLPEVVDTLCKLGVAMDGALWSALDSDQLDIAAILVKHGADTDLLNRAILENKETAAIFLIHSGCDLTGTPLHLCCQLGLVNIVRTLIEHRANVNSRDADKKTPIHLAIENQHSDIINLLLAVPEIDLTLRDKDNLTAFAAALTHRNDKAAQAILDRLPNAAEQFDSRGHNFLHIAIKKGDIESALFLLTVNVDVNSRVQDALLTPPIHLAAQHGNETLVRSLILAGARVDDRDTHKRTALHVASETGNTQAVVALLQNNADYDALDVDNNNALHVAVKEGHLNVVRALLTESRIDAEAVNLKGRNPLHELCRFGRENAAAICQLFFESMPDYPIDKPDVNGNSPLLLAYMKGNGKLCTVLVKNQACLACENQERVTIFNYQVPSKQLLNRLLDQLGQSATWFTTDSCQECGKSFSITVRTHHCRHCGRALCSKCSQSEVPIIKFGEMKPVRVCQVCFEILKTGVN